MTLEDTLDVIRRFENGNSKAKTGQGMGLLEAVGLTILEKSNKKCMKKKVKSLHLLV